jgi:hypothetical protein
MSNNTVHPPPNIPKLPPEIMKLCPMLGEYGGSYAGEAGGFMFVQLRPGALPAGVTLMDATFNFAKRNRGIRIDQTATPVMVPEVNHGVVSHHTFVNAPLSACFGFSATGFDAGDDLLLQAPKLLTHSNQMPLTQDLYGGSLTLAFSDGQEKQATFSQEGRNGTAAIAVF